MKDTERYLRQATRGLWGQERRALRTELEGHIRVRISELMVAGHSEAEAERLTLHELGAAREVSTGMAGVYALNTAVKGAVTTSLLAFAALLSVQQVQAQVKSVYGNVGSNMTSAYLNLDQLKKELEKSGGSITMTPRDGFMATLKVPGVPRPTYPMQPWPGAILQQDGQDYLNVFPLLSTLQNMGAPVQITGWKNPKITAGNATIGIETDDWRVINELYFSTVLSSSTVINDFGHIPWRLPEPNGTGEQVTIQNSNLKAGHIYALLLPLAGEWWSQDSTGKRRDSGMMNITVNAVQAEANGKATFRAYPLSLPFKLVGSEEKFASLVRPYENKFVLWSEERPAPGLLVELTGKMGEDAYTILPTSGWK